MDSEELREAARFVRDAVHGGTPGLVTPAARRHMRGIANSLARKLERMAEEEERAERRRAWGERQNRIRPGAYGYGNVTDEG